jgi:glycosyltransferase involved in cell wall biosynthesis
MDESLISSLKGNNKGLFYFLPDPWSGDFSCSSEDARKALDIPVNKVVFLFYGIGDRRKGLHIIVDAMEKLVSDSRIFLLCAGKIDHDRHLLKRIDTLEQRGSAKLINRYVSEEEERFSFCSADVVLLPYIHHYGSSGVLSRAAAAGKMVIASDEGLLAKRIREHHLGLLFQTENIRELQQRMTEAVLLNKEGRDNFRATSLHYATSCSREAFRKALLSPWQLATKVSIA